MSVAAERLENAEITSVPVKVVDCDVHPGMVSPAEIKEYLDPRWHHFYERPTLVPFRVDVTNSGARTDARPANGGAPGSDPELMERQLLGDAGVDIAILVYHSYGALTHPEADVARVTAINEWLASRWLDQNNGHGRYRACIRITATNTDAALRELDKWADHPYFVQVLVAPLTSPGFGHPSYDRLWRACEERGLPVAVHAMNDAFGSVTYNSASGPPAYNFELHATVYPYTYAAQLASLVCGGTFERIPDLKFVFIEGGISWATALGAHLDRNWKQLRSEVPHLSMAPSEYIRRNAYFSTQPIEEPKNPEALLQSFEYLGERSILFSTDYPHWDFDDPKNALPRMSKELRQKIMAGNAIELYGLPKERPATPA